MRIAISDPAIVTRSTARAAVALLLAWLTLTLPADAQEARRRWEMQRQIRLDKFEQVLPLAMRAHKIDMWIVAVKENHYVLRGGRSRTARCSW